MSASSLRPTTRWRHQTAPAPSGRRSRPALASVLLGLILSSVAGCASDARGTAEPTPSLPRSPSAAPTPLDEQAAALAQYRKFWATLTPVSRMPAAQRQAALAEVAVDPALKSLLAGMRANDEAGEVFYGAHIPHPEPPAISPDGNTALIDDCQDSTETGLASRSTLKPKTRGVLNNHVNVTMKRMTNGVWKVAFVAYTKTPC